ncbi:MAG TPA: hypothetical protein VH599_20295 [Ktedonobacterales bacterium]|jgi:hypothetical protein
MRRGIGGLQWIELLSGLAACLVGLLALGYALFAPLASYTSGSDTCTSDGVCTRGPDVHGRISLAQSGLSSEARFFLSVLVVCLIVVAISAVAHSLSGKPDWRAWLWVSTIIILIFVVLGALSIGPFIAPAGLLALVAACFSLGARPTTPARL